MNKDEPTTEETQQFWENLGWTHGRVFWQPPDENEDESSELRTEPVADLNNLFLYAPDIIVGIVFHYFPGCVHCVVTYRTEAGFDAERVILSNTEEEGLTEEVSRKKSALALFKTIDKITKR